jgi:hypothetical protein
LISDEACTDLIKGAEGTNPMLLNNRLKDLLNIAHPNTYNIQKPLGTRWHQPPLPLTRCTSATDCAISCLRTS